MFYVISSSRDVEVSVVRVDLRKVCVIDPFASKKWPNNYGVWQAEWDALAKKLNLELNSCAELRKW